MLLATAHSPPRGCIIDRLLAIDGDDWVKLALLEHPGLLMQISRHTRNCASCAGALARLFPDGVPEHTDLGGFTEKDLETLFEELLRGKRHDDEPAEPPGSEPRGDGD